MAYPSFGFVCLVGFCVVQSYGLAESREAPIPSELAKIFEKYSRAWRSEDWGRLFDLGSPDVKKGLIEKFKDRDGFIEYQEKNYKATISSVERLAVYRVGKDMFTFAVMTKATDPMGKQVAIRSWATFEWIEGEWYLSDTVEPNLKKGPPKHPKP
jgi:hypothetical protein